jgi:hypothetical protein
MKKLTLAGLFGFLVAVLWGVALTAEAQAEIIQKSAIQVQPQLRYPTLCAPKTCGQLSASCGYVADGCGHQLLCGDCTAPDTCGGAGTKNQCGVHTDDL